MDELNNRDIDNKEENLSLDDERRIKVLSPGMLVFKRFIRNKLAIVGSIIIISMFLFCFLGGALMPYSQSEVFKNYEMMEKDYAAVTQNDALLYTVADGEKFDSIAQSRLILAINNNAPTFESGGKTYTLATEGEDFHVIGATTEVASGKGIKNKFTLTPVADFTPSADFTAKFDAAVLANENGFTTDDGNSFVIEKSKVAASVFQAKEIVMAAKNVFEGDRENDFEFCLAAQRALVAGNAQSFDVTGETFTLTKNEDNSASITDALGEEQLFVSRWVFKESETGTVYPDGFVAAVQDAINTGKESIELTNAEGEQQIFNIERAITHYKIRTERSTYKIMIYHEPSKAHWLGTDANGMDVMTRLMYGGRISLIIGFVVVLLETILGVILGGIAGYFGKWIDSLIMRIVDIFNCIPGYPIYIILGAVMDAEKVDPIKRIFYLMIALGILGWPGIARIVRAQILTLREQEFMTAAEATGISVNRRIFKHLVPNVIPQLIVIDTMSLGGIILTEATLSFLGLGVKYPLASWGSIINAVSNVFVMTNYLFVWIPAGLLILLTVLGFNFIGDGLRDAFDPKMKR
ncbi:MAG: ABC transporter permease [Clostridiales bacterium]|nr:ABC transporter permease [Clostridiales bacterium]